MTPNKQHYNTHNAHTDGPRVSSPYNFVPLNERVFFPSWSPFVSHDIPFAEGLSGTIELEITAETPVFIRKPYEKDDPEGSYYEQDGERISKEFCHIVENGQKRYYIPGSSIRNMLRSIIEILGFGKIGFINEEKFKKPYPYRDMYNPRLYSLKDIRMGWLINEDGKYYIKDAGALGNLRNNNNPNTFFRNRNFFRKFSIKDKDKFIDTDNLKEKYHIYTKYHPNDNITTNIKPSGKVKVFTGNFTKKRKEFLFKNPNEITTKKEISPAVFEKFLIAHSNSNNWEFWRKYFEAGKPVPVFFRYSNTGKIKDFGLVVLYKLTYNRTILNIIKNQQPHAFDKRPDLAETIFGHINEDKLKGRIHVSHALANTLPEKEIKEYELILGEPKETFYPFYLVQYVDEEGNILHTYSAGKRTRPLYLTYNDGGAKIAGRKRYPVHHLFNPEKIKPAHEEENKDNVKTKFCPLPQGTKFKTRIIYHNLLPEELGALLSAITFHNQPGRKHNIGLAKPYGFGKISIKITNFDEETIKSYICSFEKMMNNFIEKEYENSGQWRNRAEIIELLAMALDYKNQDPRKLKYPDLQDFAKIKKSGKALPPYSRLMSIPDNLLQIESACLHLDRNFNGNKEKFDELIKKIKQRINTIKEKLNG